MKWLLRWGVFLCISYGLLSASAAFAWSYLSWPAPRMVGVTKLPSGGMRYDIEQGDTMTGRFLDWPTPANPRISKAVLGVKYDQDGAERIKEICRWEYPKGVSWSWQTVANRVFRACGDITSVVTSDYGIGPAERPCVYYFVVLDMREDWPWAPAYVKAPVRCQKSPEPQPENCTITSNEIVLDHGTLSFHDANGHSASALLSTSCAEEEIFRMRLASDSEYIPLQPHGRSLLKVDGEPVGGLVRLPAGLSTIELSDQLLDIEAGGEFSGSAVLIMEPE